MKKLNLIKFFIERRLINKVTSKIPFGYIGIVGNCVNDTYKFQWFVNRPKIFDNSGYGVLEDERCYEESMQCDETHKIINAMLEELLNYKIFYWHGAVFKCGKCLFSRKRSIKFLNDYK